MLFAANQREDFGSCLIATAFQSPYLGNSQSFLRILTRHNTNVVQYYCQALVVRAPGDWRASRLRYVIAIGDGEPAGSKRSKIACSH